MNLEKRLTELEHRMGTDDEKHVWCIALVGGDPDKMGPDRAIHYPVTGYATSDGKQRWDCMRGRRQRWSAGRATS